jgi:hypothetical protein
MTITDSARTANAFSEPKHPLTPLNEMASLLPFNVASNNETLPSNFAPAFCQLERIFIGIRLNTITDAQHATNHKSATITFFNAPPTVVNAGAAKPHQPFLNA